MMPLACQLYVVRTVWNFLEVGDMVIELDSEDSAVTVAHNPMY